MSDFSSSSSCTSSMRGENIMGLPMDDWESTEVKGSASSPMSFAETFDDTNPRKMSDSCGLAAYGDSNTTEIKAKGMNAKAKVWKKKNVAIRSAVAKRKSDPASSMAPSTPPPKFKTARYATSVSPQTPDKPLVAVSPASLFDLATQLNKTISSENVQKAAQLFTAADFGPQPANLLICTVCATQTATPSIQDALPYVCTDCSARNVKLDTTHFVSCDGKKEGQAIFSCYGNMEKTTFSCDGNVGKPVEKSTFSCDGNVVEPVEMSKDHWLIGSQHDVVDSDIEVDGVVRARLVDNGLIFPLPSVRVFHNALPGMYDSPYRFRRSPSPELVRARPSSAPASIHLHESFGHDSHCTPGDRSADLGNDQLVCVPGSESPVVVCSAQPRTDQPTSVPALSHTLPTELASCAIIHPGIQTVDIPEPGVHTSQAGQSSLLSSDLGYAPSLLDVKPASSGPLVGQDTTFSPLQRPAGHLGDASSFASLCAAPVKQCIGTGVQASSFSPMSVLTTTAKDGTASVITSQQVVGVPSACDPWNAQEAGFYKLQNPASPAGDDEHSDSALCLPTDPSLAKSPSAESLALEATLSSDDAAIVNDFLARSSTPSCSDQLQRGDAIEALPATGFANSEDMHMVKLREFVQFPTYIDVANTYVPLNALLHSPLMQPRVTPSNSQCAPEQDAHHEECPRETPAVHPKVQELLEYHNQIQAKAYGIKEPSLEERIFDLQRELNAQARQHHMAMSANQALQNNQHDLLEHLKLANENIVLKDQLILRLQERIEELENNVAA